MNIALQTPWTIERFLDWAGAQEERYEFDGWQPVAMTGGTFNHDWITTNIHVALRPRLRGTSCLSSGPNLGVETGGAVRYPDALITCTRGPGTERLAEDVRVVFEVLSPSSGRVDSVIKVREYARVPSITRYVLAESRFPGLLVLHRDHGEAPWMALVLTQDDILPIPEAAIEIPVAEFYEDVNFPAD